MPEKKSEAFLLTAPSISRRDNTYSLWAHGMLLLIYSENTNET